jgi:hypothetical protein
MINVYNCSVDEFKKKDDQLTSASLKQSIQIIKDDSRTLLAQFIAEKTSSNPSEVVQRQQYKYIFGYLQNPDIGAKMMVTEYDYVDQHFLDDYSNYFSQCFADRSRSCMRIHFFENAFKEQDFYKAIGSDTSSINRKTIVDSYLGYIVIRPLERNSLSKICFTPYKGLINLNPKYKECSFHLILKNQNISLFGMPIKFKTLPMREQDQVISACASSAIWTALSASNRITDSNMPALSTITSIALGNNEKKIVSIEKPSLFPEEVKRALLHYGFSPYFITLSNDTSDTWSNTLSEGIPNSPDDIKLQRLIYAYTRADIPILLAGSIYENKVKSNELIKKGAHLITAVGYRNNPQNFDESAKTLVTNAADTIDRCYVHDDRYGPFTAINLSVKDGTKIKSSNSDNEKRIFKISKYSGVTEEYIQPEIAIIPCPPGLNLTYISVEQITSAFIEQLEALYNASDEEVLRGIDQEIDPEILYFHINVELDIKVQRSNTFKQEFLIDNDTYFYSSICDNPEDLMIENMPKFIWLVELKNTENNIHTTLIFDATEIGQGKVFLGYIAHTERSMMLWQGLKELISPEYVDDLTGHQQSNDLRIFIWDKIQTNDFQKHCSSIKKRLEQSTLELDALFGKPRLPRRNLHKNEISSNALIIKRNQIYNALKDGFSAVNESDLYNWVVNEAGDLIFAKDIVIKNLDFKIGHPTLIDFKTARLGGEFYFDASTNSWLLNTNSGTYSKHLWKESRQLGYLLEVWTYFFQSFQAINTLRLQLRNYDSGKITLANPRDYFD